MKLYSSCNVSYIRSFRTKKKKWTIPVHYRNVIRTELTILRMHISTLIVKSNFVDIYRSILSNSAHNSSITLSSIRLRSNPKSPKMWIAKARCSRHRSPSDRITPQLSSKQILETFFFQKNLTYNFVSKIASKSTTVVVTIFHKHLDNTIEISDHNHRHTSQPNCIRWSILLV